MKKENSNMKREKKNKAIKNMNEFELRDSKDFHPDNIKELTKYIDNLLERNHDYGTTVYAVSLASIATFNYMARKLGITGFQASCADLDILKRTRCMKSGFRILNYENLLYPQYLNNEHFPTFHDLIKENIEELSKTASKKINESKNNKIKPHPNVMAHWIRLKNKENII